MKAIRLSNHAIEQCKERGTNYEEVVYAIKNGLCEQAKKGRVMYRANFQYKQYWNDQFYTTKQVAPIVIERENEMVVITVYTYYF